MDIHQQVHCREDLKLQLQLIQLEEMLLECTADKDLEHQVRLLALLIEEVYTTDKEFKTQRIKLIKCLK